MASWGRRAFRLGGVLLLAAALVLSGCGTSAQTRKALKTAQDELGHVHAQDLGQVLGRGTFGSAGISGSRPTAFVAVQTLVSTDSLMARIGARLQRAGFAPFVPCRPPATCTWRRRADNTLITADAVVQTGGEPWGEKSTAHGTVPAGRRVLQVSMTVGG